MSRFRESEAVNPMAEMRWPRADDGNPMTEIRCRESMMRFWLNSLSHGDDYEREEREIEQAGLTHNRHKREHLSHDDRLVITLWTREWQWVSPRVRESWIGTKHHLRARWPKNWRQKENYGAVGVVPWVLLNHEWVIAGQLVRAIIFVKIGMFSRFAPIRGKIDLCRWG